MNNTADSTVFIGWRSSPNERGTIDLIWSCFSTVFLCLWSMLHLNVPAPTDGFWTIFWRKARWMLLGILAPEVPMMFAAGQWSSAKRSVAEMQELGFRPKEWTLSHAFFADMGGISLKMGEDDPFPITAKQLVWLIRHGHTGLPPISQEDIKDKSKGDIFTKLLAIAQTCWFTLQMIGRVAEALPITPIELASGSLALTSLATLRFWHAKPLDAQQPYVIVLDDINLGQWVDGIGTKVSQDVKIDMMGETLVSAGPLPTFLSLDEVEPDVYISRKWSITALQWIYRLDLQRPRLDRIPNDRDPQILGFKQHLTLGVATAAFASLHFIDFNFAFPTQVELVLWRVNCCLMWLLLAVYGSAEVYIFRREGYSKLGMETGGAYKMRWPVCLWFMIPAGLYFVARVIITAQVFISLRGLPSDAYREVEWTKLLPHI